MAETDGVDEALSTSFRTTLMAAGQIGQQLARLRENQLRHNEAQTAQEAREFQNRLDAERLAARASLEVVNRSEWWDAASPADITDVWQTASAWRNIDPAINKSADRIESEVAERWRIDINNTGARPDQVREHLTRIVAEHAAAQDELAQAKRAEAEAAGLLLLADGMRDSREGGYVDDVLADEEKEDRLRADAAELSGLAEGHRTTAQGHLSSVDEELRDAKVTADKGQALPAPMATMNAGKRRRKAAKPAGDVAQQQVISR